MTDRQIMLELLHLVEVPTLSDDLPYFLLGWDILLYCSMFSFASGWKSWDGMDASAFSHSNTSRSADRRFIVFPQFIQVILRHLNGFADLFPKHKELIEFRENRSTKSLGDFIRSWRSLFCSPSREKVLIHDISGVTIFQTLTPKIPSIRDRTTSLEHIFRRESILEYCSSLNVAGRSSVYESFLWRERTRSARSLRGIGGNLSSGQCQVK